MMNVFKILTGSLLLSVMLAVASVAQPVNLATNELALLQKDKQKERERPVERDKPRDEREKPRDEKKDDKKKKPDEHR